MNVSGLIQNFGPLTITGLAQGAIIALFALGYTLVYGVLRLINFAHSEVFLLGTYACLIVWGWLGLDQNSATPSVGGVLLYLVIGLVVAIVASGLTALAVELVAYRPLRKRNAPPLAFLITAIGASLVISEVVGVATHRNPRGVPPLIQPKDVISIGNTHITNLQLLIIGLALVMMFLLDRFINTSRLGRGIRAVAQNPDSAALMGVNKSRVIALVFLLGGLMAGIAAVMYDLKIGVTKYDAGFLLGIEAFTAAVLGGIGNLRGALLGGLLLGLLQNYAAGLFGTQWLHLASFVALVLILLFRPTGLLGESLGRARA
ncbi:branched-chain amino acid ABC transporter permease [Actinoplanes sp. SE50]|uniref:branched-chain amino acid ABC transporter permease n=1 Tax=unclassified Actinoplanes TaxID=2626549 RepID=UPI00023ECFF4|nr:MULTISPECIES: branched-chain amino acid ABC transporter permease [unclassified Actinoplanes]AEV82717.1 MglC-like galactoside transport system permease protein [Actinoplanes sp. SE50/110]ATO81113.1 branched-chain amino acid ABC transporter permease [Actinoplanes sp. SE50]SLL98520.1 ABC-type BCAA transporter, permease component [Actinoplanes sp. SE50/110]